MQQVRLRAVRRLPIAFGWLTKRGGRRLARLLPRGPLTEIDDSYTLIPLDRPARLTRAIQDFGNRLKTGRHVTKPRVLTGSTTPTRSPSSEDATACRWT